MTQGLSGLKPNPLASRFTATRRASNFYAIGARIMRTNPLIINN
jgi:hypothetical protein